MDFSLVARAEVGSTYALGLRRRFTICRKVVRHALPVSGPIWKVGKGSLRFT